MLLMLLSFLVIQIYPKSRRQTFYYTKLFNITGEDTVNLSRGTYLFECWGAQGGAALCDGLIKTEGGRGAYASGVIKINSSSTFHIYVGGKGADGGIKMSSRGGYNGGGDGGLDPIDNDNAGAGGGASDIRINKNSLYNRIIVAAGGSGAVYDVNGAPGGDFHCYRASSKYSYHPTNYTGDIGIGQNGVDSSYIPSSGGGGGYYGGISMDPTIKNTDESYLLVGCSGSSFISNNFQKTLMINGESEMPKPSINFSESVNETGHEWNGAVRISQIVTPPLFPRYKHSLVFYIP